MRTSRPRLRALLYAGCLAIANPATAGPDPAALRDARMGEMKKLAIHDAPKPGSEVAFIAPDGAEVRLADFAGHTLLLNFWATWCAPCRKEMPALDALAGAMADTDLKVVIVATGKNNPAAIEKFFEKHGITTLQSHLDPNSALARDMGIFGLPITLVIDPDGQEIARLRGDADWNSDDARAILSKILAQFE